MMDEMMNDRDKMSKRNMGKGQGPRGGKGKHKKGGKGKGMGKGKMSKYGPMAPDAKPHPQAMPMKICGKG